MRFFSASELLDIWERGAGASPVEQALVILAAAFPQATRETLMDLAVDRRDAALFHLRERTFGPQLKGLADCPACHERLELAFGAADLRARGLLPVDETLPSGPDVASFRTAGCRVRSRLPTSADLMKAHLLPDAAQARRSLLDACILSVEQRGRRVALDELSPKAIRAIVERIGKQAALADLTIPATCPACGHRWEIIFDIVSYFWNEIAAWATRLLHEVHYLASTYGWREADILTMSAWRRQRYLELIGV